MAFDGSTWVLLGGGAAADAWVDTSVQQVACATAGTSIYVAYASGEHKPPWDLERFRLTVRRCAAGRLVRAARAALSAPPLRARARAAHRCRAPALRRGWPQV